MPYFSTLMLAIFITVSLIPALKGMAGRLHMVDRPNARKVHVAPMPKVGGVAMVLGTVISLSLVIDFSSQLWVILLGALIIALAGMLDDMLTLGYKAKFGAQLLAALLVIYLGGLNLNDWGALFPAGFLLPDYLSLPFTLLLIVGVTNAVNLADGLDGLAGGLSLLSFLALGYVAFLVNGLGVALISLAVVGAIFGFLRFNTWPATIFMGDTGSQFLGFLMITLAIELTRVESALSPLLVLPIIGFPVIDTLTVMAERISKGVSPFKADKNHFHHKIMRLGFHHFEAVLAIYLLHSGLVLFGFLGRFSSDWFLLIVYLLFAGGLIAFFTVAEKHGWQRQKTPGLESSLGRSLKRLRDKQYAIKLSFRGLYFLLPLLLCWVAISAKQVPVAYGAVILALVLFLAAGLLLRRQAWKTSCQIALFLAIPIIVFLAELQLSPMAGQWLWAGQLAVYGLVMMAAMLTLKFTRRKTGYRASPLDYLIIFIAVVVPNIPDPAIQSYHMGLLATKVITLFLGYAVLLGELRQLTPWLVITSFVPLLLICGRSFGLY